MVVRKLGLEQKVGGGGSLVQEGKENLKYSMSLVQEGTGNLNYTIYIK